MLGVLLTPVGIAHIDLLPGDHAVPIGPDGAGAPSVSSDTGSGEHGHCFTCRWLHSLRSTVLQSASVTLDAGGPSPMAAALAVRLDAVVLRATPARAPPAAHQPQSP